MHSTSRVLCIRAPTRQHNRELLHSYARIMHTPTVATLVLQQYAQNNNQSTTRMHTVLLLLVEQSSIRRILHKVLASSIRALVRVVVSTVCIFVTVSYAYYCNTLQYELRDEFFRNVETPLSVVEIFIAFVTQLVAEHRDTLDKPPPQPSLVGISVRFAHHVRHYRGVRRRNSQ